ncbi:hypothetical protein SUGI_1087770 [Cryptomeria japonica]|uniref:ankyrin repeat-containing protein ITN1 n=1 Tax=Cryptomeria japonica TaxID=3369 RepID=UPI002414A1A9|nr:ankyrin repeat-containing protein ITN1 [Cryptomeria japonica]GLJ51099.1 hypothetical protein SUGI_1087770 [Cryptomeria japonica]
MENACIETAFFEACESGDIAQAKMLLALRVFDPTRLVSKRTPEGRTCLHLAVLAGSPDLLKKFKLRQFINEVDNRGDTALYLAVWKYRLDLVTLLLDDKADCKAVLSVKNNRGETPLCIAVKFGSLDVVKKLIDHEPEAVQKLCKDVKILHLAVNLNRARIVGFFIKKSVVIKNSGILRELINQRAEVPGIKRADNEGNRDMKVSVDFSFKKVELSDLNGQPNSQAIVQGDTPLHIAARNKSEPIVDTLLRVPGVNQHALNSEGKTPLDVAREVTEYYESFRIIKKLTDYKPSPKPFMYCAPEVSKEKHKRATDMVNKTFDDRRNTELVVAALLATMTFTAVFTVPGGSYQDSNDENRGTPILLAYYMFKLFIIFDCISFFLSLFVCIMWQMASELTTEDKMLFITVSGLLTCLSFGFNSCRFMAAVHTILAHKDMTLAWVILGILLFIEFCVIIAFIHQSVMFAVGRARFHRLCGVPRLLDSIVEGVWERAESFGVLKIIRSLEEASHNAVEGDVDEASHNAIVPIRS